MNVFLFVWLCFCRKDFRPIPISIQTGRPAKVIFFQFCRSLSDFYGRLYFAKRRNGFLDCQSVAIESSPYFHFRLHGKRSTAFQLHREAFALLYFASERQQNHRSDYIAAIGFPLQIVCYQFIFEVVPIVN